MAVTVNRNYSNKARFDKATRIEVVEGHAVLRDDADVVVAAVAPGHWVTVELDSKE